jgi:hypothetical protein
MHKIFRLHYKCKPVGDFPALVALYASKPDLASPCRSTVPLLSLVRDGRTTLLKIFAACDIDEAVNLHFEFTVEPQEGEGNASHTDLMVRSDVSTSAIEAKWTEPRGKTVAGWIKEPPTESQTRQTRPLTAASKEANRRAVMNGWLGLLQVYSKRKLVLDDFMECLGDPKTPDAVVRYQMVHRAASACFDRTRPQLVYLQFTPLPNGRPVSIKRLRADLIYLRRLLGDPAEFPFYLIEVEAMVTTAFYTIAPLKKGSSATGDKVRQALLGAPLFEFTKYKVHDLI